MHFMFKIAVNPIGLQLAFRLVPHKPFKRLSAPRVGFHG
jgi:hypothetical protein